MQGSVPLHHRKFFRRSPDTTLRPARARRPRPTARRAADGPRRRRPDVPGPDRRRGTGGATVNCPTTRCTTPVAAPRTGRGESALPNDPGLDAILADPNLSSTAKALVTVMVRNWAWYKDHCWPSDATLAKKVGKSIGHVQRCLRELERAGRIERERTDAVPNGRWIWLLWRCTGPRAGARRDPAPARTTPTAPARSERVVIVNEGTEPEIRLASRRRPEADPVPTPLRDTPPPATSTSQAEESPEPREPLPTAQAARKTPPAPVSEEIC